MVRADYNQETGNGSIILTPNNSATWRFNVSVISSLAIIAGIISLVFILRGLWLILLFTGFEILVLYYGLYLSVRANFLTEVITFRDNLVTIERGHKTIEDTWEYQRSWAKIFVHKPRVRHYATQIFIRSHGKELELGSFLNKKDKETLIRELKHIIHC